MSVDILAGINALTGVVGSALVDAQGQCVAFAMPAPYDPVLVSAAVGLLRDAFEHLSSLEDEPRPQQFFLHLEESSLVVRWAGDLAFVVVAAPARSNAMLSVALNAAALKLANADLGQPGGSPYASPNYASGPPSPAVARGPASPPSSDNMRPTFGLASHDSWAGRTIHSEAPTPLEPPPAAYASPPEPPRPPVSSQPEVVDPKIIEQMTLALGQHVGPIAKSLVKRELVKMGAVPDALGRKAYCDLVMTLARSIKEPALAGSFSSTALRLVGR